MFEKYDKKKKKYIFVNPFFHGKILGKNIGVLLRKNQQKWERKEFSADALNDLIKHCHIALYDVSQEGAGYKGKPQTMNPGKNGDFDEAIKEKSGTEAVYSEHEHAQWRYMKHISVRQENEICVYTRQCQTAQANYDEDRAITRRTKDWAAKQRRIKTGKKVVSALTLGMVGGKKKARNVVNEPPVVESQARFDEFGDDMKYLKGFVDGFKQAKLQN